MNKKLEPCPFCGGTARIIVCDDEGNHHTSDYENDPWSGLGFMLYHDEESNPDCPIAHEIERQFGRTIYDTYEEAITARNRRAATEANEALTLDGVAKEYLEICGEDCAGDPSVGLPSCPFYNFPDVDVSGELLPGGCKLAAYRRPPASKEE